MTNPGQFKPGQSGNPKGRPQGSMHKATIAVQAILDGEAQALTRKAVELAQGGNVVALRLCLERIAPPKKDRPINLKLPEVASIKDIPAALNNILEAVATGEITPQEGQALASMIEAYRKGAELACLEARLDAIESVLNLREK